MRKLFLKISMVLLGVTACVNTVDAQTLKVYFASLKVQTSEASVGSGNVKLTWVDITGKPFEMALGAQLNGYALSNPSHISGPAETAQLIGATMCAMDGVETAQSMGGDQIYMTSYVYFHAEAEPAAGSYLSDWTFTDPAVSRIDTAMGNGEDIDLITPCFKVLPDTTNNAPYAESGALAQAMMDTGKVVAQSRYNNIYAVFKKYLLSNPQVTNGQLEASEGATATLYLSVDVEGDVTQYKENFGDFVFPTYPAYAYQAMGSSVQPFAEDDYGYWTWDLDDTKSPNPVKLSSTKSRAYVKVTYTAKSAITVGTHRANITISVAGGAGSSSLTIPLSVNALDASRPEATLLNGKDSIESGNFADLLAKVGSYSNPVIKLKRPQSGMTLSNKAFTLDLNGNSIGDLTVNGGNVTVAYSRFGGTMSSINVTAGKLTLNGGTIDASGTGDAQPANAVVAINVANGATLIQNGATIRANATLCYAIGINADGNVTVTDGSIDAHAGMTGAFAVQVGATGKLTTTGGTFNASVDQSHTPTASPTDQSTWSNAYAVYVTDAAGVANLEGGIFNSTSSYSGAFAVCPLATFGKMTIGEKAVVSAHTVRNQPVAYAVGSMGSADLTVNGGRFSATYMKNDEITPCPPFLCAGFANLTFKSGIIKADSVYVRDAMFQQTQTLVQPKLFNVVRGGSDWQEGYRYIAVDESKTTALEAGVPACRIGTTGYTKLEDAIAYANNNPNEELVIFMTNDYTLPANYYTLPAKATLVVPMSDSQPKEVNLFAPRVVYNDAQRGTPYAEPTEFRRLTFANGVNMDIFGNIELTCSQLASNEAYTSQPTGAYGHLVMEEGSHMTLQSGSEVRAWGFITGKGETDARRGSKVREIFQLGDWKGAFTSVKIVGMVGPDQGTLYNLIGDDSDKKIFPVTQYFIQNIESPVKYHPGAVLSTSAAVSEGLGNMSVSMAATEIAIVGVTGTHQAIFLMDIAADAENTWVRKWYDAENDIQVYDINSGAHIGSMVLDMGELTVPFGNNVYSVNVRLNSAKFDLPLTSNFKIHLLSGTLDFMQNTCLLPGAEVEVDKEATVSVATDNKDPEHTGALYVYDADDWNNYAFGTNENGSAYAASTKTVRYAPSWNGRPTKRNESTKEDAKINVHGTFTTATGFVYTSVGNGANSEYNPGGNPTGGANIFSSNEDAGTFIFNESASEAENPRKVYQVKLSGSGGILGRNTTYDSIPFYPARLKNGNGEYVNTDAAAAGDAYCYQNDEWLTMTVDEDNPCFMKKYNGNTGTYIYYAKPQEYVAITATKTYDKDNNFDKFVGNADHTFSNAASTGRLFILMDNCQWWEVEKKDNLYHCIHPNNDTYYYWDDDVNSDTYESWQEKKFTITWKNWNGTPILAANEDGELDSEYEYKVTYGTMAEFLGTNPTREKDADSTYNFTGWKPALGPVTQDVTYTATFQGQERKYTITFLNEGGTLIETQFLTHNATPVCKNTPTKIGHILQWSPAIGKVVADATYTATWLDEMPTKYEIRFLDYDGTVLKADSVEVGGTPTPPAYPKNKPATAENTYTCSSWDAEVVPVTEAATYTAVYTPTAKTFTVIFQGEDGKEIERHDYKYGETPVCSETPTKENTRQYSFSFAWTPQIQTVQGEATYRAVFTPTTNKYTVTLLSNLSGVCTFTGAGTFEYGREVKVVVHNNDDEKYEFTGWSDGEKNATHPTFELEGDIMLTANFKVKSMPNLEITASGTETLTEPKEVKDLIITSDGITSGQLIGAAYLDIKGEAIFRMNQSFAAGQWYAVAVPWQVDIRSGVYAGNSRLSAGSQFYVIDFDASAYAGGSENTFDYWKFLHQTTNTMLPGKLYMIYLTSARNSLDFHMKKGTSLITIKTSVSLTGGSGKRANWNAIANPALYKADLVTGAVDVLKYNGNDSYITDNTENMIVGEPVFVQVNAERNVPAIVATGGSGMPAYRRAPQAGTNDNRFIVEMTSNDRLADRIIVQTAEDKADEYIIGMDLAKIGISSKVAQMWMERYNANLCKNTIGMKDNRAEYPLYIFAPVVGEYFLSAEQQGGDYTLYLTRDGEAIANLSDGAYSLSLEKGTTNKYGLRISARVPQVATSIDEAVVDSKDATATKVLYNGQVFIIRGEKVYTIDGQLVK